MHFRPLSRPSASRWTPVMVAVALVAFTGLSYAQTGVVTFSQSSYSVNVSQSNALITVVFTGSAAGTGTVGFATSDGTAVAGVDYTATTGTLVFTTGVLTNSFEVLILDNGVAGSTQTVNLALSNPTGSALLGNPSTAILSVINTNTQEVKFAQSAYEVDEGSGNAVITLVRTGVTNSTVSVDFATSDGTAKAGVDYTATTGTVTFAAGVLTNTFEIPILESGGLQTNQTINLALSNPVGTVLGRRNQAVLTIVATGPTVMQFTAPGFGVHEHVGTATVSVIRFGATTATATVDFATSDGTARNGIDYTGTNGTLVFPSGAASTNFSFPLVKFSTFQSNKTVIATLSNPVGGSLGTQVTAVVTIVNDRTQTVTFTNSNGDVVTITLQHGGTMDVSPQPSPVNIAMFETDVSSVLTIKVKKSNTGSGLLSIGGITGAGDCGLINGPNVDLVGGGVQLGGYLKQLKVHDVLNGAAVTAGGTTDEITTVTAHNIGDGTMMNLGSQIGKLQAVRFGNGAIVAPSIASMSIKGDKRNGIAGDFDGQVTLSGVGVAAGQSTLAKLVVSGTISNASINVADGNLGSLVAFAMLDSTVSVGYTPNDPNSPLAGGTFVPGLRLGSLQIKSSVNGFANSDLVAAKIGSVHLTSVLTDNGGTPFGILANDSISSVTVKTPAFKWSQSAGPDQSSGDFHVVRP